MVRTSKTAGTQHLTYFSACTSRQQQTLDEEKATDRKLTSIAEAQVNRKAA
jgi:ferritin-like metal-binding protein YciE